MSLADPGRTINHSVVNSGKFAGTPNDQQAI
jgi:hypothetical protein